MLRQTEVCYPQGKRSQVQLPRQTEVCYPQGKELLRQTDYILLGLSPTCSGPMPSGGPEATAELRGPERARAERRFYAAIFRDGLIFLFFAASRSAARATDTRFPKKLDSPRVKRLPEPPRRKRLSDENVFFFCENVLARADGRTDRKRIINRRSQPRHECWDRWFPAAVFNGRACGRWSLTDGPLPSPSLFRSFRSPPPDHWVADVVPQKPLWETGAVGASV